MAKKTLFSANDGTAGTELWITDGTDAGTFLLKDLNPGSAGANPTGFTRVGDKIYFAASGGAAGRELWVTDGTAAGTRLLADINPGAGSSNPDALTPFGGKLLFQASDGANGTELWVSDGTAAGTVMMKDVGGIGVSGNPTKFFVFGDKVLFTATTQSTGYELWITDGTPIGTALLLDIAAGFGSSNPISFTRFGDKIVFSAWTAAGGSEMWVTDGTAAGTVLFADLWAGSGSSSASNFTVLGNKLVFAAEDGNGRELWVSDGTAAGTVLLKDINSGTGHSMPAGFTLFGDKLVFSARSPVGIEPWITDGTPEGTMLLKDMVTSASRPTLASSDPGEFTVFGGRLVFSALGNAEGRELWSTDGTAAGTVLVKDINIPGNSNPTWLHHRGDGLLFSAQTAGGGTELWKTDGTGAGTMLVKDIAAGSASSGPQNFFTFDTAEVGAANVAPTVQADAAASYREQAEPVALAPGAMVADANDALLAGATVAIAAGFLAANDLLTIGGSASGIAGAIAFGYNAATGVLSLSGSATVAEYQALLRQIAFSSTSDVPGSGRTLSWVVTDGSLASAGIDTTVAISAVDDPVTAAADSAQTDEATATPIDVLANDRDPDGPAPSIASIAGEQVAPGGSVTLLSGAMVTLRLDGILLYDPGAVFTHLPGAATGASNSTAQDHFSYGLAGGGGAEVTVTISGISGDDDIVWSSTGGDTVTGTAAREKFLMHEGGADVLFAGGGDDYFYFGASLDAEDRVDGGEGHDSLALLGAYDLTLGAGQLAGVERIVLYSGTFLPGGDPVSYRLAVDDSAVHPAEQLALSATSLLATESLTFNGSAELDGKFYIKAGAGADSLTGGAKADMLDGGAGVDMLRGGDGKDWLVGGAGADLLEGGAGVDKFVYHAASASAPDAADRILDFENGDKIKFVGFDANGDAADGVTPFAFIGSAAFHNSAGELRASAATGDEWLVEADIDGDGIADFALFVTVAPGQVLSRNDFEF
ncbi:MAG TPA: ELWxxDGT repeat protein [Allosphingosinicella sp.]